MTEYDYDVETCSEVYKEYIRVANYGDTVSKITDEYMVFIYKEKKITVNFKLDFWYDFDDGFGRTEFSNFKCNSNINDDLKKEFENCIKSSFVTSDRLSG